MTRAQTINIDAHAHLDEPGVYRVVVGENITFQVHGPDGRMIMRDDASIWGKPIGFTVTDGRLPFDTGGHPPVILTKAAAPKAAPTWEQFRNRRPGRQRRRK